MKWNGCLCWSVKEKHCWWWVCGRVVVVVVVVVEEMEARGLEGEERVSSRANEGIRDGLSWSIKQEYNQHKITPLER